MPNTYQDLYGPDGQLKQRRYYGPDGKVQKDTDFSHPGDGHTFPHDHNWDWSKGKPNRSK